MQYCSSIQFPFFEASPILEVDILHVMNLLGHRNIESTLIYTQLISFESDEYHSAVANVVEEVRKLLEEGFEYVCQKDDIMLFRKRK